MLHFILGGAGLVAILGQRKQKVASRFEPAVIGMLWDYVARSKYIEVRGGQKHIASSLVEFASSK